MTLDTSAKPTPLTEVAALHCETIDTENAVIRGVKLLGLESRNGRRYLDQAVADAVQLYEGARVNVNHPKGHPHAPRDYAERLGVIKAVEHRAGDGLYGELHFNPKHALAEQLLWDAQSQPTNVGLSHNVLARTIQRDGKTLIEAITKVVSVDLVADPATTTSLFESREPTTENQPPLLTPEELKSSYPEFISQIRAEVLETASETVKALMSSGLDAPAWDTGLIEQILFAGTTEQRDQIITDRQELYKRLTEQRAPASIRPKSSPKPTPKPIEGGKEFAALITAY